MTTTEVSAWGFLSVGSLQKARNRDSPVSGERDRGRADRWED